MVHRGLGHTEVRALSPRKYKVLPPFHNSICQSSFAGVTHSQDIRLALQGLRLSWLWITPLLSKLIHEFMVGGRSGSAPMGRNCLSDVCALSNGIHWLVKFIYLRTCICYQQIIHHLKFISYLPIQKHHFLN